MGQIPHELMDETDVREQIADLHEVAQARRMPVAASDTAVISGIRVKGGGGFYLVTLSAADPGTGPMSLL